MDKIENFYPSSMCWKFHGVGSGGTFKWMQIQGGQVLGMLPLNGLMMFSWNISVSVRMGDPIGSAGVSNVCCSLPCPVVYYAHTPTPTIVNRFAVRPSPEWMQAECA